MAANDPKRQMALQTGLHSRSDYEGTTPPAVAEIRQPAKLMHMRPSGDHLLIAINDNGNVRLIRVTTLDAPGLELLSATDRAAAQSALSQAWRAPDAAA
jgi:hypothetical protein